MNDIQPNFSTLVDEARAKFFPIVLPGGVVGSLTTDVVLRDLFKKHWQEIFPTVAMTGDYAVPEERAAKAGVVRQNYLDSAHRDFVVCKGR